MPRGIVLSLFDFTGVAVRPWAEAGYECHCFDIQHPERPKVSVYASGGSIAFRHADLGDEAGFHAILDEFRGQNVVFAFGFAPCTDLAVSGTRHWAAKAAADPDFQIKAAAMSSRLTIVADGLGVAYMGENPVGALKRLWRDYDHTFHPCEYGGYLDPEDVHPLWPDHIPPRDAYTKKTCLWTGNGFVMPPKRPVEPIIVEYENGKKGSPQWGKLGGKSLKTKNIRSATPRGFARAVFEANAPHLMGASSVASG